METRKLTLSELTVGQTDSIEVDVSIEHVDKFLDVSGDHSPIHVDEVFAKERGLGGRIAHGLLIGSFVSQLIGTRLPGCYGIMQSFEIGFRKPLVPPETIRIKGEIINISSSTGQVTIKVSVVGSLGDLIATAKVKTIVAEGKSRYMSLLEEKVL